VGFVGSEDVPVPPFVICKYCFFSRSIKTCPACGPSMLMSIAPPPSRSASTSPRLSPSNVFWMGARAVSFPFRFGSFYPKLRGSASSGWPSALGDCCTPFGLFVGELAILLERLSFRPFYPTLIMRVLFS